MLNNQNAMKFKYYDLLSHIVPGYVIYQTIVLLFEDLPDIETLPSIAFAFIIGYFINTLGSWLEGFYRLFYKGKPSIKLLQGKDTTKVRFYEHQEVISILKQKVDADNPSLNRLFAVAMNIANNSDNSRVYDFNASYALSRAFLTSLIIVFLLIITQYYDNLWPYLTMLPLIIITWKRLKERDYYYAREVLLTVLRNQ